MFREWSDRISKTISPIISSLAAWIANNIYVKIDSFRKRFPDLFKRKQLRGINRAGAEYGVEWNGWNAQLTYFEWPTAAARDNELNHWTTKRMDLVRLPISWERLQRTLNDPFDALYRQNMIAYVDAATAKKFYVIIDLHNYGRYAKGAFGPNGNQVDTFTQTTLGDGSLTFAHISNVWKTIAEIFINNDRVIFNLMNEQHDAHPSLDSTAIFNGYQEVVNAIRLTGARQLILFPNTRSSDVKHWDEYSPQGGPLDSVAALTVTDPANNIAFDMHSYSVGGGGDDWAIHVPKVTAWAKTHKKKLFLSELGTELGAAEVAKLLTHINANDDVWLGWAVWNLEPYSITKTDQNTGVVTDTLKMAWYAPYF